jgi:DUF1680 family protein
VKNPAILLASLCLLCPKLPAAPPNAVPVFNRAPLAKTPFANLPLGSVRADGWLKTQLELQRDGLTGNAELVIPELGPNSGWRGGNKESWEKGPYYLKGLIALAYTLDDPGLKKKAQVWLDAIFASQQADGFYGPGNRPKAGDDRKGDGWWPRMVVDWALKDYYDATGDERVMKHLSNYYRFMAIQLPKSPLLEWSKARAGDEIDTLFWLYNRTGDAQLLEVAALLRQQAWDWVDIYTNNRFQHFGTVLTYHNVNMPQAFKFPLMSWQLSGAAKDRDALTKGWQHLERDHGLAFGMTAGTELLSGKSPTQGTEMCSFVEQMLSFYLSTRILGDAVWADRAETIAFNGMPAGITKDFKQFQYYTIPNQVIAIPGKQGFNQDYSDGIIPGPHSGCHCCCYNLHMGWPMLAQHAWMASADQGLAAVIYAPTRVTTTVADTAVTINEETNYPFAESIALTMTTGSPVEFPLHLRIPDWCAEPVIAVNGTAQTGMKAGSFFVIKRTWTTGDTVALTFPMAVRVREGVLNTRIVERGPLIYALRIGERFRPLNKEPHGFPDLSCEPTTPWNYALAIDQARPASSFTVSQRPMPANPFIADTVPLLMTAKARKLPQWTLAPSGRMALDPPVSPVASGDAEETVTLIPIGATTLHVTNLPWLGAPVAPPASFQADFNDGTMTPWVIYGGNASVKDGRLSHGPSRQRRLNAVVPALSFKDLTLAADVTIGAEGTGGLILRASQVASGSDSFKGYSVSLNAKNRCVEVGKSNGVKWRSLGKAPVEVVAGRTVRLQVVATGNRFQVFVGDLKHPVLTFTDGDHVAGTIGVRSLGTTQFAIDSLVATAMP